MKEEISKRISSVRKEFNKCGIQALIIPSTDPHLSEYIAPHWKIREWISGFSGSAGTIVITENEAGLWTDSRYFLQAAQELKGSEIKLYKEMLPDTPSIPEFLCSRLKEEAHIGIDGKLFSVSQVQDLQDTFERHHLHLKMIHDIFQTVWTDRPNLPDTAATLYPIQYAGIDRKEKIEQIRAMLKRERAQAILLSALDEIAWTLNLRGNDIEYNPVVISYLFISQNKCIYFINPQKIPLDVLKKLEQTEIEIRPYNDVVNYFQDLKGYQILIDPHKTNYAVYAAINANNLIIHRSSPVSLLKSIRNEVEIKGLHQAMLKDGVALVKFLRWLEKACKTGVETELSISNKLHQFRAEQALYQGESFATIAAYQAHAAIVHYSATQDSNTVLQAKGFLLIDSGAQYLDGTTDTTRTIALGELSEEEKLDYTLVLKGHISLAMAKFPAGTRGAQLDVLARMPLWQRGLNYLHGTGHGVGHFLNVHEGPQSIRMNENPITLQPGMLTSNEPGLYKTDKHGIRIENLILVCKNKVGMFGDYYQFETVTLCPICKKGIIKEMLTEAEINWFNQYHQRVYDTLSPYLLKEEKEWLSEATSRI